MVCEATIPASTEVFPSDDSSSHCKYIIPIDLCYLHFIMTAFCSLSRFDTLNQTLRCCGFSVLRNTMLHLTKTGSQNTCQMTSPVVSDAQYLNLDVVHAWISIVILELAKCGLVSGNSRA